jgi:hypothetical protein
VCKAGIVADIDLAAFTDVMPLGSGGLGDVYRATRRSTGGEVAIKVLRDWSDRDVAWQRAQRELRALVDLRGHSNVVNVEEVVESDGTLAIVMEFAPGGSISDLMRSRGGPLGFAETLLVAEHTAAALAAAHDRGIIHRDIKPHNLLIGTFGQVKVCDFGIASLTRSDDVSNRTSSLSLRYASPEELRGDAEVGPAADIYSLAATVHQLLTGHYLPVPDGTAGSLPLRSWHAPDDVPADVELEFRDLIVRSGDRNPTNRPTAEELRDRCEALSARLGPARCRSLTTPATTHDDATTVRPAATTGPAGEGDRSLEQRVVTAAATTPMGANRPAPDPAITVSRTTVLPTADPPTDTARAMAPPGRRRSVVVVVGAFATLTTFVVIGIGAFAFGWFGSDDTDAATPTTAVPNDTAVASPSASTPPIETAAPTTLAGAASPPATSAATATTPATTTPAATTRPTTTPATTVAIPDRYAGPTCPGGGACIVMASIDVVDGEYSIEWSANFAPATSGTHAHFFWDVYDASQVGSASADRAPWELTDRQPFVPEGELLLANRPANANGVCVTPADADHAVIDPTYYHCALVGPDGGWTNPST